MRTAVALGILRCRRLVRQTRQEDPPPSRGHGIDADLEALSPGRRAKARPESVVRAIDDRRFDYLAAQLADPDARGQAGARRLGGNVRELVKLVMRSGTGRRPGGGQGAAPVRD